MVDIVRKTTSLHDPLHVGFVRTYYVNDKEVYQETLDKNLDIEKHSGTMPDGIVKEFFENGKVYFASTLEEHNANRELVQAVNNEGKETESSENEN